MQQLGFDVVFAANPDVFAAYGVQGTPHTLVVSPRGKILASWAGAYAGRVRDSVSRFFHVSIEPSLN
jgi:hypothetical protein